MDQLKIGDSVRISSSDGTSSFAEVYSFSHKDPESLNSYLQIQTAEFLPIEISKEHMLYTFEDNNMKNDKILTPAENVKAGDYVVSQEGLPVKVLSVHKVTSRGAYAPLTASGDILVNGLLASNYVAHPAFASLVTPSTQHWMQHGAFLPYRTYCSIMFEGGVCAEETYDPESLHSHGALPWLYLLRWLEERPRLVPGFLYAVALPGHWLLLNLTTIFVALLGYVFWKRQTKDKSMGGEDNCVQKISA